MNIQVKLAESRALSDWLAGKIDGFEFATSERSRLAAGCLDMAIEHHRAIVLLISLSVIGSAFALVRPLLEAYVRGVWLHRCASEAELAAFKADNLDRTFSELLEVIEKLPSHAEGELSDVKQKSWKAMCSFTHSGFLQVVRRNTALAITPNYKEQEIAEALTFANTFALLTAMAIASLSEDVGLAEDLLEKAKQLWGGDGTGH